MIQEDRKLARLQRIATIAAGLSPNLMSDVKNVARRAKEIDDEILKQTEAE